jgi:hypothetical protein
MTDEQLGEQFKAYRGLNWPFNPPAPSAEELAFAQQYSHLDALIARAAYHFYHSRDEEVRRYQSLLVCLEDAGRLHLPLPHNALPDCTDNSGEPYQSQWASDLFEEARAALSAAERERRASERPAPEQAASVDGAEREGEL